MVWAKLWARNEKDLKFYFKAGLIISFGGSVIVTILSILLRTTVCTLFGSDAVTTEYVAKVYPVFSLGFIVMAVNAMISAYLYSRAVCPVHRYQPFAECDP